MELEGKENGLPFKHVVIAGAGTMGAGIAQCCVQSGYKTTLFVRSDEKAAAAHRSVAAFIERRARKLYADDEVAAQKWAIERLGRLNVSTSLQAALSTADLFIEAIVEDRAIKQSLFEEVERLGPSGIVLVTNTSAIRLSDLGSKLNHPELLGGLHFLSPVPQMKLVEVVKSEFTAEDVTQRLDWFGKSLEKKTIICKDTPGFVVNRMILPLLNSAHVLADEGVASYEDIDTASRYGLNLPIGLLSCSDLIGLDTIRNANKEMMNYPGVMDLKQSATLDRLIAEGRLGRKTGSGFFNYAKDGKN